MYLDAQLYNQFDIRPYHIRDFLLALAKLYELPDALHFLDVGCGPGRLLLPMAEQGWQVSGLEPDAHYYAAARDLLSQSPQIQSIRQGGFEAIHEENSYHLIAAVNNPFAYLLDNPTRLDALNRMLHALKPGGVMFLNFFNLLWHLRYYRQPEESRITLDNGDIMRRITHYTFDWHTSTLTHTDLFYRNETYLSTQSHTLSIVAPQTVISLIQQTGFVDIRTYNSYAHIRPERINGGRIMISAQKPG